MVKTAHHSTDCLLAKECQQAEALLVGSEVPDWVHDASVLAHDDMVVAA